MGCVDEKPLSFPAKVMMVGDSRYTCFCYKFRYGYTQGDVHRNSQGIFRDDNVNIKVAAKLI